MKTIQMPKALQPLLSFAEASEQDTLVFTEKRRPVAALVSLRNVARESLALSTNPVFWKIIERSRKQVRAGQTITLEALEKKYGVSEPDKGLHRARQRRARR